MGIKKTQIANIGFYHLGNGYSVADSSREKHGDYLKIAHINRDRSVNYYVELDNEAKEYIENYAKTSEGSISISQPEIKVLEPIK